MAAEFLGPAVYDIANDFRLVCGEIADLMPELTKNIRDLKRRFAPPWGATVR
jgi:hypothetical protein